jgi:hypothetical protein
VGETLARLLDREAELPERARFHFEGYWDADGSQFVAAKQRTTASAAAVSERVLGHAIPGVEGVYDRHSYDAEKAHALTKLAALVETIINPPTGNVIDMQSRKGSDA